MSEEIQTAPRKPGRPPKAVTHVDGAPPRNLTEGGEATVDRSVAVAGAAATRPARRTRKPFGSLQQKLYIAPIPGFHIHWFNDMPGRIDQAREAGYEHILDETKKPISRIVGRGPTGNGMSAYAMKIPTELWEEDRKAYSIEQQAIFDGIQKGQVKGATVDPKDRGAFYQPEGFSTKITHG